MSNRYVPLVSGIVFLAAAVALPFSVREWWVFVIGAFLLYFGWVSLRIGITASDKEIEELTTSTYWDKDSEDTLESVPDETLKAMNVHPDDADLVRIADMKWFISQGAGTLNSLAKQDMASVVAAIKLNMEELGMDEDKAAEKAFRSLPIYYKNLDDRFDDPLQIGKLPFCIKDRVNRALPVILKQAKGVVDTGGSVNQVIRDLIGTGRM